MLKEEVFSMACLPVTKEEMLERAWNQPDFV
jgi:hypothetical protein